MFRQIRVHPEDADFQRIFWRTSPDAELLTYRLLTVTYGTSPAPFLANRVIKQLAQDEADRFPLASPVLENNVYVDDIMFGAEDIVLLKQIRDQLNRLLMAGGFRAHKWASNDCRLLEDIPSLERALITDKAWLDHPSLKILGIKWNPSLDQFEIQVTFERALSFTKRSFLSLVARIYDPLGWISPVTVRGKIIIQSLWLSKLDWDTPLTGISLTQCLEFQDHLDKLREVSIPRWTGMGGEPQSIEIHGFSDASNLAYASVVFLRVESPLSSTRISLLYSRTRVAPLKVLSVPRLELCAAVLLARSVDFVRASLCFSNVKIYCWSDSSVVLAWLSAPPARWSTFVANRVSEIQTTLPTAIWRHVPTRMNPADCASRGLSAAEFLEHDLWWVGPPWLRGPIEDWPHCGASAGLTTELELRSDKLTHCAQVHQDWQLPYEVSSWPRLLRITAYVRRFISNVRVPVSRTTSIYLAASEISLARLFWIRNVQAFYFDAEIKLLKKGSPLKSKSSILSLNPQLDEDGILRVGGRLRRSGLADCAKFPIILPKCRLSELIVRHTHVCALHGGLQLTLRLLRQHYWILRARNMVKKCVYHCVVCARQRAVLAGQRMGDLPVARVTPSRPFEHVGVDYAGPFAIRSSKGRGQRTHKAYCALFVCLATRAIHLEVADDCSTRGFLAAFDRFASRRGLPSNVYSDNGTNFKGAEKELRDLHRRIFQDPDFQNRFASEEVTWNFIPPAAPQFGGLWEAGVKGVKFHLRRIIGEFTPSFEEFSTLLCKIECCLNSRPIAPLFEDPENFDALTPGHFLVGSTLKSVPHPSLLNVAENRLSRWQTVQRLHERFWKIWSSDYLNSLQQRKKWKTSQSNLLVGDMVLLRNSNLPPTKWDLGRVIDTHAGTDGLVRVVTVRTAYSTFKRPVTQLCKLPVQPSASSNCG